MKVSHVGLSVISGAINNVVATVQLPVVTQRGPGTVTQVITPSGVTMVYVANFAANTVFVISCVTDSFVAGITVGECPFGPALLA